MSTVFVTNISFSASSQDLGKAFEAFGALKRAFILTERIRGRQRSLGKGFVEFETAEAMNKAIAETGKISINGRNLIVQVARPKQPRVTAFIGGIPKGTTVEQMKEVFKAYNPTDARIVFENTEGERPRHGFGFVKFASEQDLDNCVKAARTVQLNGGESIVRFAKRQFDAPPRRRYFRRSNRRYRKAPRA